MARLGAVKRGDLLFHSDTCQALNTVGYLNTHKRAPRGFCLAGVNDV